MTYPALEVTASRSDLRILKWGLPGTERDRRRRYSQSIRSEDTEIAPGSMHTPRSTLQPVDPI